MKRVVELLIDLVSGTASAVDAAVFALGVWIAALDHEARNHSVELSPVIVAFPRQLLKVCGMVWSLVIEKPKDDSSKVCFQNGDLFADFRGCHTYKGTDIRQTK